MSPPNMVLTSYYGSVRYLPALAAWLPEETAKLNQAQMLCIPFLIWFVPSSSGSGRYLPALALWLPEETAKFNQAQMVYTHFLI